MREDSLHEVSASYNKIERNQQPATDRWVEAGHSRRDRSMKERRPIFYDEERVRWRFTRRVLGGSGVLLTPLLVAFFVAISVGVDLPAGLIADTKSPYRALKTKKNEKPQLPVREGRHRRVANLGTVPSGYDPLRAAFYISYDANSLASLKKHYKD